MLGKVSATEHRISHRLIPHRSFAFKFVCGLSRQGRRSGIVALINQQLRHVGVGTERHSAYRQSR